MVEKEKNKFLIFIFRLQRSAISFYMSLYLTFLMTYTSSAEILTLSNF